MTNFINFLKEQDQSEIIYLGTNNGSGWIVIDTVEKIIANIDKIEKHLRNNAERVLENAKMILKTKPFDIVDGLNKLSGDYDSEELKKIKIKLEHDERKYANAFVTKEKYSKIISKWKTIDKRRVVNTYDHETDEKGICILVDGIDNGTIWFKGEHKGII